MNLRLMLALCLLAGAVACGPVQAGGAPDPREIAARKIRVVTTIGQIADVVANLAGDRVELVGLMGPGIDPHLYRASEGDVVSLAEADIVFYSGLHLEAKMADVFEKMRGSVTTVAVTEDLDRDELLSPPEFEGAYDPHVWFDVTKWMSATEVIRDSLMELDPEHADLYEDNADGYLAKLEDLDRYVATQAGRVPEKQRVLITAHDAFNYFGEAYDFEVRGLQGISTATETGTADLSELADFIVEREIPAIFVETSVPQRFAEALREAVAAQGSQVSIGGSLYSDAMGDAGTPEGTYIGMVRHNIDTIVAGLTGRSSGGES
ncbi:MAG: metal ABC transporter solute-binding protein, Zn/Mn family [Actinomycetota bacterium]